jgi:hypothetical protein
MASYKLVVFSDSTEEGNEGEYNDWYTNQHLKDVVAVPGFVSAQRFKLKQLVMGGFKNKYMAIYNIESDDPQKVMDAMMERRGTEAMLISDSLDVDNCDCALFETISAKVAAPSETVA